MTGQAAGATLTRKMPSIDYKGVFPIVQIAFESVPVYFTGDVFILCHPVQHQY